MNHAAAAAAVAVAAVLSFLGMKNNRLLEPPCPCHLLPPTLPPANHSQCPIALFWSRWTNERTNEGPTDRPPESGAVKPQEGRDWREFPKTPALSSWANSATESVDRKNSPQRTSHSLRPRTRDGLPAADGIADGGGGHRGLNNRYGGDGEGGGERKTGTELDTLPISIWRTNE